MPPAAKIPASKNSVLTISIPHGAVNQMPKVFLIQLAAYIWAPSTIFLKYPLTLPILDANKHPY